MHNLEKLVLDVENEIVTKTTERDNLLEKQKMIYNIKSICSKEEVEIINSYICRKNFEIMKLYKLKNKIRILFENNLIALIDKLDYIDENDINKNDAIDMILKLNEEPQHYKVYKNMRDLR